MSMIFKLNICYLNFINYNRINKKNKKLRKDINVNK